MGMDICGLGPKSQAGAYFRNNVWYWHPLWTYCCAVAPELTTAVKHGHLNDGDGLDEARSVSLAAVLLAEVESGRTRAYEQRFEAERRALPPETCRLCQGTGVRTDEIGVRTGQPEMLINKEEKRYAFGQRVTPDHPRFGQKGWCNGCHGVGSTPPDRARYGFSVENVREFATFLSECGGFAIR